MASKPDTWALWHGVRFVGMVQMTAEDVDLMHDFADAYGWPYRYRRPRLIDKMLDSILGWWTDVTGGKS